MDPWRLNPAQPEPGTVLCWLDEIADPGAKGFDYRVGEAMFAGFVVRQGQRAIGYVDSCPHAGWPLSASPDRYLTREGDRIFCSGHGAQFAIDDGACLFGPCAGMALTPWLVEVDADGVVRTAG
jgi:nitrite reductase/ring-hydroxylating ferredoxin subunit